MIGLGVFADMQSELVSVVEQKTRQFNNRSNCLIPRRPRASPKDKAAHPTLGGPFLMQSINAFRRRFAAPYRKYRLSPETALNLCWQIRGSLALSCTSQNKSASRDRHAPLVFRPFSAALLLAAPAAACQRPGLPSRHSILRTRPAPARRSIHSPAAALPWAVQLEGVAASPP